ncbi:hypothetical protein BV22DRAFT_1066488 [Leucogyrophana mollusca]|uniref:Uncharacterized protein n=1 Tax=Leucogyrophana mollusca TaxID=85980 RepID=A0ACB8BH65_9AGAM|nr:hypothetical protein BV22DRAFT_1066488 [Leucogyrophana mollusca]
MTGSSTSDTPSSPTSLSSVDIVSAVASDSGQHSEGFSDDDEVVWRLGESSGDSSTESSLDFYSDGGDFIILHQPLVTATALTVDSGEGQPGGGSLSTAFDRLSVSSVFAEDSSSSDSEEGVRSVHRCVGREKKGSFEPSSSSESGTPLSQSGVSTPTGSYQEAAAFITEHLRADLKDEEKKLALLQALIVELGVRKPNAADIPSTLTSAKKVLKTEAHINIKEYVAIRAQGQAALQRIMHPSRGALAKSIRKKGNRAPLKWVKSQGLQVLLVTCFA